MVMAVNAHWAKGFFAAKGGFEYPLTLLVASLALGISGAGAYSLDALFGIALAGGAGLRRAGPRRGDRGCGRHRAGALGARRVPCSPNERGAPRLIALSARYASVTIHTNLPWVVDL